MFVKFVNSNCLRHGEFVGLNKFLSNRAEFHSFLQREIDDQMSLRSRFPVKQISFRSVEKRRRKTKFSGREEKRRSFVFLVELRHFCFSRFDSIVDSDRGVNRRMFRSSLLTSISFDRFIARRNSSFHRIFIETESFALRQTELLIYLISDIPFFANDRPKDKTMNEFVGQKSFSSNSIFLLSFRPKRFSVVKFSLATCVTSKPRFFELTVKITDN